MNQMKSFKKYNEKRHIVSVKNSHNYTINFERKNICQTKKLK